MNKCMNCGDAVLPEDRFGWCDACLKAWSAWSLVLEDEGDRCQCGGAMQIKQPADMGPTYTYEFADDLVAVSEGVEAGNLIVLRVDCSGKEEYIATYDLCTGDLIHYPNAAAETLRDDPTAVADGEDFADAERFADEPAAVDDHTPALRTIHRGGSLPNPGDVLVVASPSAQNEWIRQLIKPYLAAMSGGAPQPIQQASAVIDKVTDAAKKAGEALSRANSRTHEQKDAGLKAAFQMGHGVKP